MGPVAGAGRQARIGVGGIGLGIIGGVKGWFVDALALQKILEILVDPRLKKRAPDQQVRRGAGGCVLVPVGRDARRGDAIAKSGIREGDVGVDDRDDVRLRLAR
jgi:hypothetical protein